MSEDTLSQTDVSVTLAKNGITILPAGADAVVSASEPPLLIEALIESYEKGDTIDPSGVSTVVASLADETSASPETGTTPLSAPTITEPDRNKHGEPVGDTIYDRWPGVMSQVVRDDRPECVPRLTPPEDRSLEIQDGITGQSTCTGTYEDFSALFRSRYEKLARILKRKGLASSPIATLQSPFYAGEDVTVSGMVRKKWTSRNDNPLLLLEDTTGETILIVFTDEEAKEKWERIIEDEVVGVSGQLSDSWWSQPNDGIMFGNELHFPDVPYNHRRNYADRPVKAAFISDVHLGAEEFAYDKWDRFVDWIRQQEDVEYLLVGGDLVEGIGVYPNQDEELDVVDIYDQYEICAEAFRDLPDDLTIISIVGNHDTGARLAEPQPTIPEKFSQFFDDNVHIVGNPARVLVEGVDILMYHGMSINTFTDNIMEANLDDPTSAMELMLEKRHLAPKYGANVRLAPEAEDHLVIDEVPDILHCGHVHKFGDRKFRAVTLFNTSCWQYQTDFQKSKDIDPDVGFVTVVDLSTHQYTVEEF